MFEAQTCPAIIIPTGTFSPAPPSILQSNSYIRTTESTSLPSTLTIADPLKIIKLDAHPSDGYVLLNPGFSSTPTSGAFIAQALDGCGTNIPARMDDDSLTSSDDLKIEIFPNPSKDLFYISFESSNDGYFEVYSLLGIKILQQKFSNNSMSEINLENLPSEVYLVKINSKNKIYLKKIVKK